MTEQTTEDTGVWVWTTRYGHTYKGTKGECLAALKSAGQMTMMWYDDTGESAKHICGPEDEPWWSRLDWVGDIELTMDKTATVEDWRENNVQILAELKALIDSELRKSPGESLAWLKVTLHQSN